MKQNVLGHFRVETGSENYLSAPFPSIGRVGAASSDHVLANQAALEILRLGGNAVDATIAITLTLGFTCPYYTGIGGGGFVLVWFPGWDAPRCLDYREVAPRRACADMFSNLKDFKSNRSILTDCGQRINSTLGGLSAGVASHLVGWGLLHSEYGQLGWSSLVRTVVEICEAGIVLNANYLRVARAKSYLFAADSEIRRVFLDQVGPGQTWTNPDLMATYRKLADQGWKEFYQGDFARISVEAARGSGGVLEVDDFLNYRPVWRDPLFSQFRDHQVYGLPRPSQGGYQLAAVLSQLDRDEVQEFGSLPSRNRLARLMRDTFETRARSGGFGPASPGGTAAFGVSTFERGVVIATESVNLWWGSGVVPEGGGFLLNNVMDDFCCHPGEPDAFGLFSTGNEISPGVRPASSSCPVMVLKDGLPAYTAGSAGGSRIPTSVLQLLLNCIDGGMNVQQSLDATRLHHQWRPDVLWVEPQCPQCLRQQLTDLGHEVQEEECRSHAAMTSLDWGQRVLTAGGDFRSCGAGASL